MAAVGIAGCNSRTGGGELANQERRVVSAEAKGWYPAYQPPLARRLSLLLRDAQLLDLEESRLAHAALPGELLGLHHSKYRALRRGAARVAVCSYTYYGYTYYGYTYYGYTYYGYT